MTQIPGLDGYIPEKIKDGRDPIKGKFKSCIFNSIRVEDYTGEVEDLKGTKVLRYEIEIKDEGEHEGRRFWKNYYLGSEIGSGKKNKTPSQKLADALFTLGYSFKNMEELEAVCEELSKQTIAVSAYFFTNDKKEEIQVHVLKAIAQENTGTSVPF